MNSSTIRTVMALATIAGAAHAQDWKAVEAVMGRPPVEQPGNVHRFNFPRADLTVTLDGVTIKPGFALGTWVSMTGTPANAMAMGDLVVLGEEMTPVITRLQQGGIEQTAIHHHLIRESPTVFYVHIMAHGDAIKIAETVKAAVALTKTPPPPAPGPAADIGIDTAGINKAIGATGRVNGGILQFTIPRVEPIIDGGMEIPPAMGMTTALNFQPTGGGKAAINGDFVLTTSEVTPVARTLREHGIEVISLHSHLTGESPRLNFMHFWANADAVTLAKGLRAALDKTNVKR